MSSNFPAGGLDNLLTNQPYVDGTTIIQAAELNNLQDAIDRLEAKVGVNNSVVATSHDYLLTNKQVFPYIATGSTDISATLAEADMTDMTLSPTTKGTKMLVIANFSLTWAGASAAVVSLYLDSVKKRSVSVFQSAGWTVPVTIMWLETGMTPGAHTAKIRWNYSSNGCTQPGSTANRTLIVLDIP